MSITVKDVMIGMNHDQLIRDASGRYACPNLICWRRHQTGLFPPETAKISDDSRYTRCPNCHVDIDWVEILLNEL